MTENTSPENLRKFLESDDPAMVMMGLSMAKGSGVSDEILGEILWMYMMHDDKTIRAAAKSTFIKIAPDDVKQIVKKNWKASYRKYSRKSMYILKNIGPEISIKVLISALKNKDRSVRCEAARALGQIGDKRAVEPLIESLKRHESELVWRSPLVPTPKSLPRRMEGHSITNRAAAALGNIGDKRAVKPLIKALEDNLGHRAASYSVIIFIKALEKIGDKRAVKPLIKVLDFTRSSLVHGLYFTIQLKAISALGNMGDKRAIEPITNFLNKNQDWGSCQLTGKEALEKLK